MNTATLFKQQINLKKLSRLLQKYRESINAPYQKKDIIPLITTLVLMLFVPLTVIGTLQARDLSSRAEVRANSVLDTELVKEKTNALLNLLENSKINSSEMAQIINFAEQRKTVMLRLAETNPKEFLNNAFSGKILGELPEDIASSIEKPFTATGEFSASHFDKINGKKNQNVYLFKVGNDFYNLYFAHGVPAQESSTVSIRGIQLGNKIVLDNSAGEDFKGLAKKVLAVANPTKVAVMMVNFQNDTSQPITATSLRNNVYTGSPSVNTYYQEVSYNKTSIQGSISPQGDIFGWYTLTGNGSSYCSSVQELVNMADTADQLGSGDGFLASNYRTVIYAFPSTDDCGAIAGAIVGGTHVWVNYTDTGVNTLVHEIGHSLGLDHSNSFDCVDNNNQRVSYYYLETNCTSNEYGDPFDVMGSAILGHFNNSQKLDLGYLDPNNILDVKTSGTYTIVPLESSSSGVIALRIPYDYYVDRANWPDGGVAKFFYLEFRQPIGFDSAVFNSQSNVANGVSIRVVDYPRNGPDRHTKLIDTTPDTTSFLDSALGVGQTFTDSTHGITIKTVSVSSQGAVVDINFSQPECVRAYPSLTISPSNQWVNPGDAATYTYTVTNNDSGACGMSTMRTSLAIGIKGAVRVPDHEDISLEPGETKTSTFQIQTSDQTPDGTFVFRSSVTNIDFQNAEIHGTFDYIKDTFPANLSVYLIDNTPPSVSISSPKDGDTFGQIVTISTNATDDKGLDHVDLYLNGYPKNSDASCYYKLSCSVDFSIDAKARGIYSGTYVVKARAFDRKGNWTDSGSVTITLTNGMDVSQNSNSGAGVSNNSNSGTPSSLADINSDGKVDIFDLSILLSEWTKSGSGDLNSDGKVDIYDLSILLSKWGT